MQRIILFALFLCLHWVAWGQESYEYRYWFDYEDAESQTGTLLSGEQHLSIDLTGLNDALHIFRFQVKDTAGVWSVPISRYFLKMPAKEDCTTYYWFDEDAARHKLEQAIGHSLVDVSHLMDGLHLMYLQAVGENSESATICKMFIRIPQTEGVDYLNCVCYIDGQLYKQEHVASEGGAVLWNFDVSDLALGLHHIQLQVLTPSGAASSVADRFFFRTTTTQELESMQLVYCMDGTTFEVQKGTAVDGVFHFDVDVASLADGLHTISYMLSSNTGTSTRLNNAFFWKIPVGGYGIKSYSYWLNDNEANAQVKVLDNRVSSFSLVSLLPVESVPIRSSCFQFEVKDGVPTMFAKNDFHIVFYDASNRRVDETKQFVDFNVSQAVEGITDLQPTQTFERPQENTVKWFKFDSAPGDTIAFKANQAVSIQVFTPTGKEILSASEDKSVEYSGIHTWEEGTHYVAVHDVTGSKPNITLDYVHMDKYDVVSQDVHVVGNGGCSTITFQGNGFRDLYAVDLLAANGDTIHAIDVGHESDASTTVTFDFTGASLGEYNALFHFAEEDKMFANNIVVEEAKEIELTTKVSYPSTFLRGSSVTYSVEITNKGNMTAYEVPIYIWIKSHKSDDITSIKIDGLKTKDIHEYFNTANMSKKELEELMAISSQYSDDLYFSKYKSIDYDNPSDSICVRSNYFFTIIAPNESKTINVTINSNGDDIQAYFTIPEEWPSLQSVVNGQGQAKARMYARSEKSGFNYCCIRNQVECILTLSATCLDIASLVSSNLGLAVADCVVGSINTMASSFGSTFCGDDDTNFDDKFANAMHNNGMAASVVTSLLSCISAEMNVLGKWAQIQSVISKLVVLIDFASATGNTSCQNFTTSKQPGCPPIPPHGGSSRGVNSLDPNDIYGYVAISGSKFVGESVVTLPYRIEFENDTTFATASAHVVEIKDTLDSNLFDLATFAPTDIKIGNKTEHLDGTPNFVKTMDMRPAINTIAQIEGKYDQSKGIATWTFTSLDPMTMEPTDDVMQGFLPVNNDGVSGMGEVSYNISLKNGLVDGTEIPNRASIVFDSNAPIMTPLWVNTVDAVSPTSRVVSLQQQNDTILTVNLEGADERSGVWKYEVYAQYGKEAPWWKIGECTADSAQVDFRYYNGIDYGFCVLATDSAGNVEDKELVREANIQTFKAGDVNGDDEVNAFDVMLVQSKYLGEDVQLNVDAADVNGDGEINVFDTILIQDIYLSTVTMNARRFNVVRQRKQKVE
ncbi:MAG: dockerin type I domain-containing protein [Prevotella sp.]